IGQSIGVTINFDNESGFAVPAPFTQVVAGGVEAGEEQQHLYGTGNDKLPWGMIPNHGTEIAISYQPMPKQNGAVSGFELSLVVPTNTAMRWISVRVTYRASYVRADGWDAVWANFPAVVGDSLAEFY